MRGGWYLLVLLLMLAPALGEELNSTEFVAGDQFLLDDVRYEIVNTYDDMLSLKVDGWGAIMATSDCDETTHYEFCVDSVDNYSTEITFYRRDFNISIERDMPNTIAVGEEFEVELILKNNANEDLDVLFKERTNATTSEEEGFTDGLTWEGKLTSGQRKRFTYNGIIDFAGTYPFVANATSLYNDTSEKDLIVTDHLKIYVEAITNTTAGEIYNFTMRIVTTENDERVTTKVAIPRGVYVNDTGSFTATAYGLRTADDVEDEVNYWFTYYTENPEGLLNITITTDDGEDETTRVRRINITESAFKRILLIHDHNNKILPKGETVALPFTIHNPNDEPVDVDLELYSVLIEEDESFTIKPKASINRTYNVFANASGSTYNLHFILAYEDYNNNDIVQDEDVKLLTLAVNIYRNVDDVEEEEVVEIVEEKPVVAARIGGTVEGNTLQIQISNAGLQAGVLTITRDGKPFEEQNFTVDDNATITKQLEEAGAYGISYAYGEQALSTTVTYVKPAVKVNETVEPEEEKVEQPSYWKWGIALAVILIIILLITNQTKYKIGRIEKRIQKEEMQIGKDTEYLQGFVANTKEDMEMRGALQEAIGEQQEKLRIAKKRLEELRKQNR